MLKDEIGDAVCFSDCVDRHHVGVVECCHRLGFTDEPLLGSRIAH